MRNRAHQFKITVYEITKHFIVQLGNFTDIFIFLFHIHIFGQKHVQMLI